MENGISVFCRKYRLGWTQNISLACITLLFSLSSFAVTGHDKEQNKIDYVLDEVLVQTKEEKAPLDVKRTMAEFLEKYSGKNAIESVRRLKVDDPIYLIKLRKNSNVSRTVGILKDHQWMKIVEPNYVYYIDSITNDTEVESVWALDNHGQNDPTGQKGVVGIDLNLDTLWSYGYVGSKKVVVGVIDSGIDWEHPDLKDNLYENTKEIAGNGIDDDGNGYIDDIHGWNFKDNSNKSDDDNSHGTHCAGIIGAVGNNAKGISGVNWEVTLMPLKFLGADGSGGTSGALEAIEYGTKMGVQILSNSWGGGGKSSLVEAAINKAEAKGILFVAAAGNDGTDNTTKPHYPSNYTLDNVVSVAATDNQGVLARFSNYSLKDVHVAAPGVNILSTVPFEIYDTDEGETPSWYRSYSGTSMATPYVSGVAALMLAANSSLSYADIKSKLISTSVKSRFLDGKVVSGGIVNAYNAFYDVIPKTFFTPSSTAWVSRYKSLESDHPYKVGPSLVKGVKYSPSIESFKIQYKGAKYMRVNFEKIDVEEGFDYLRIVDKDDFGVQWITGSKTNFTSEYVKGDTLYIKLYSDYTMNGFGFKVKEVEVIF